MSSSNPSHLLISRNPRSLAHPQLVAQTSLYAPTPTPGAHLFSFGANGAGAAAGGSTPPAGEGSSPAPQHARSQSTPALTLEATAESSGGGGTGAGGRTGGDEPDDTDEDEDDDLVVHPTFWRDAALPGRVKVIVGRHEFWCHKEVLWFSSPFFNSMLRGSWAETDVPDGGGDGDAETETVPVQHAPSSPTDTDKHGGADSVRDVSGVSETRRPSTPPQRAEGSTPDGDKASAPESGKTSPEDGVEPSEADDDTTGKASVYLDAEEDGAVADIMRELREIPEPEGDAHEMLVDGGEARAASVGGEDDTPTDVKDKGKGKATEDTQNTDDRLKTLRAARKAKRVSATSSLSLARRRTHSPGKERKRHERVDAVVELHEESPAAFQDFLFWAYPHLECKVTWSNVAGLLALASKHVVPALQTLCERFLMTHASGRPIMALALAEQHLNSELYREASRFVLDQASWDAQELECLTEATQLKLSKRRTWFLERLLKLGSFDVKKEYACRQDCPDPSRCRAQLDEKWRQAHQTVSRYGPPQPSVAFRCLRQLETFPTNPSLVMSHPLCQSTAKSWIASLFDRMFELKMAFGALSPGTDKYWLYITLN